MWFDNSETEASLLRDYGNKYWSGLLLDYYRPRACIYFKYMIDSLVKGENFPLEDWRRDWIGLTNKWQSSRNLFAVNASGDALNISRWLYDKYLLCLVTRSLSTFHYCLTALFGRTLPVQTFEFVARVNSEGFRFLNSRKLHNHSRMLAVNSHFFLLSPIR
ncbi:unnamed protein product [Musa textilis]